MKTVKMFCSAAVLSSFALFTACGDDDSTTSLPPIGGYNSADDVAAAALKAYWPLNGNGNESKSNTQPNQQQSVSWVEGVKGQGASFNFGFLAYPEIAALAQTSGSASISVWAKVANMKNTPEDQSSISPIFSLTRPNDHFGNLNLLAETHGLVSSDSIQMKGIFRIKNEDGSEFGGDAVNVIRQEDWMDNTHTWNANKIGGQWAHVVYTYDGATATNRIYVNGVKISNSAWEVRNGGDAKMLNHFTPTRPVIGALETVVSGTNTDTWNAALKGQVDEVRFYDKALSQQEIGALYELERAGR